MTKPDDSTDSIPPHRSGRTPDRIGPYLIKRRIASGGMGTVYEGVQENPRRPVAVKVMRPGIVSPGALRRFEYEAQLLGRLHHPGIAQVYQAGTHGAGEDAVPYFAMEYIPNAKSLTRFSQDKKLDTNQRLELFARICDAVHHGHQKGIVHRDLKPSNILVDSQGNPRIIDFGVAHATDSDVALATMQTEVGQLIGSVQYMSPEQFEADPHDIDIRSDVYAMGVVLYELLRGAVPYDLSSANIYEASRIVREEDPPPLSDGRSDLRGDLQTLVQKAMEKDRDRRYQSAFGLAQDIRRYLNGETILARSPTIMYQLQTFARRNKLLIGAVIAVFIVLVVGVATSISLFVRAEAERDRAEAQTVKAKIASKFLQDMIHEAIPMGYGEQATTMRDLLNLTRDRVPEAFADEPEAEAEICRTLGWGYLGLTEVEEAHKYLSRAYELRNSSLGERHALTVSSRSDLARINSIAGRFDDGLSTHREIVEISTDDLGHDHPETLDSIYGLVVALAEAGEFDEAEVLASRLSEDCHRVLGGDHDTTLSTDTFRAGLLLVRGDKRESESLSRTVLADAREAFGAKHWVTRAARSQLGAALLSQGKTAAAAELYENRSFPDELGIVSNFQGELDPKQGGVQILVFWESWCPFSQRAMPELENYYRRFRSPHFSVVGVTTVNRTATEETVRAFIRDQGVSFPIVRSDGSLNQHFQQSGTPFVTILKDGAMVWENRLAIPEEIPAVLLEGLVSQLEN